MSVVHNCPVRTLQILHHFNIFKNVQVITYILKFFEKKFTNRMIRKNRTRKYCVSIVHLHRGCIGKTRKEKTY